MLLAEGFKGLGFEGLADFVQLLEKVEGPVLRALPVLQVTEKGNGRRRTSTMSNCSFLIWASFWKIFWIFWVVRFGP